MGGAEERQANLYVMASEIHSGQCTPCPGGALNKTTFNLKILFTSLDVAEDSRGEGTLNGLEALPDHRVVTDVKYLAATRLDQQTSPID